MPVPELCDESQAVQLEVDRTVPYNIIRRDEKRSNKEFRPTMSADAFLDLGASPVRVTVRASESSSQQMLKLDGPTP
jgi:hypothetical protein